MKLLNTRALVLSSRPLGERDRLLSLLTRERGKISAVAPGARKIKSKLAAGVDYFSCCSFLLYQGKSLYTVNQLEIESNFCRIRENIKDYAYGMYFAELVEKLLEEGDSYPDIFDLLFDCWGHLDEKRADREVLARFFEIRMLSILGYHPHFQDCVFCGDEHGPFFWNHSSGGVFCGKCRPEEEVVFPFSRGTHALAVRLLSLVPGNIANIRAVKLQKKELQDFTWNFLQYWTSAGNLKGLSFLAKLNNCEGDKKVSNAPE